MSEYIGDGVWVDVENGMLKLWVNQHRVLYLESATYRALKEFAERHADKLA